MGNNNVSNKIKMNEVTNACLWSKQSGFLSRMIEWFLLSNLFCVGLLWLLLYVTGSSLHG